MLLQHLISEGFGSLQRIGKLRRILAPSLRHLWSASASTAGDFCGLSYPIARFQTFGDEIVTDGGDEAYFRAVGGGQERGEGWGALLDGIDEGAELVVGGAVNGGDDHAASAE